ncbi:tripartite tricarboxylate transporter substrate binding protein [Paenibacillus sp. 481]|uniref:tripartite tricarboxylate transporter substrate binding protein n=1 Tax=Paenibacillus sp. 481 TaxID=2835869 RepID=UPI001E65753C|nr:tripartite tricarboxylate transporter substrate binding protein [Paenibacillus sp. 481]UHA72397.1 tripartite tricarboxylate transporter substrate binding protein [Paenibacillus sp. 481]
MTKKPMRWKLSIIAIIAALSLSACNASTKSGDSSKYPEKPIVVVAPSGAGGGWDKTARSLTKVLTDTKLVSQALTVENKPGGGGAVFMAEYATKEVNNPYSLFVNSPPILINNWKDSGNSPYGYKDTTPLAQLTKDYGAIVVGANSKYNDMTSLLQDIKADPTKITVAGGSAPGSMDHLIAVLPAFKFGIDPKSVKYVSYDGGGEAMAALLGNNADVIATDASSIGEYLKAGKIKVLGITSPERLGGDLKDITTMKEQGIDAEFTIWRGLFGPKNLGKDELAYWDKTIKELVAKDEWKKELQANGWESEYRNADEFKTFLGEQETLIKVLLDALGMVKK